MPTGISWTDETWNPTTGCSHVSDGCRNCYAEALSLRRGWSKHPWGAQYAAENVVLHPDRLGQPLHWKKPRRVFVNSMSDLWHERVPDDFLDSVFAVMAVTPRHTFQVLTKRPERMLGYLNDPMRRTWIIAKICKLIEAGEPFRSLLPPDRSWGLDFAWPLPNVWLGVSVEDQRRADERIPLLFQTPAAVRFLSCEPLLGEIDLRPWLVYGPEKAEWCLAHYGSSQPLSWVIVGGESGPHHRAMELDWARQIRDQCVAAGVPYFFKQGSGPRPGMHRELDGRLWEEFPEPATAK